MLIFLDAQKAYRKVWRVWSCEKVGNWLRGKVWKVIRR